MQYKYKLARETVNLLIKTKKIVLKINPFDNKSSPIISREDFIDKIDEEISEYYSHLNNPKRFK